MKSVVDTVFICVFVACRISLKHRPISFFECLDTAQISETQEKLMIAILHITSILYYAPHHIKC